MLISTPPEKISQTLQLVLSIWLGIFPIDRMKPSRQHKRHVPRRGSLKQNVLLGEMLSNLKQLLCALEGGIMDAEK